MSEKPRVRVSVWDLPTRLFHWTLVLLVLTSVVTGQFDSALGPGALEWHRRSGLAILGLLLSPRVGLRRGHACAVASFLRGPRAVAGMQEAFSRGRRSRSRRATIRWAAVRGRHARGAGDAGCHGALPRPGGLRIRGAAREARLAAVSDRLGAVHEANFYVIAALVTLHVAAIVFYTVVKRQDLVGAIITGDRRLEAGREAEASRGGGGVAAAAIAIAAAAAVWALVGYA